jgi:hypothetical protein
VIFLSFDLKRRFENHLTSLCVLPAILAGAWLSLARARESHQREHALGAAPALRAGALRANGFDRQAFLA